MSCDFMNCKNIEVIKKDVVDLKGEGGFFKSKDDVQFGAVFKTSVLQEGAMHLALARPELDDGMPLLEIPWLPTRRGPVYGLLEDMCKEEQRSPELVAILMDALLQEEDTAHHVEYLLTGVKPKIYVPVSCA